MADNQNDIKSISISVTARTKEATDKLNALLGILNTLQSTAKAISLPSKSISQFANSLEKISQINLNGLSRKLVSISNAFQKMNFNGIDTKALNAEAKLLNAQAKLQNAKVKQKAVAVQETKAALTQQRLVIAQQNANTAAAKQARLSQALQLGTNARASRAGAAAAGQTSSGDESWLSAWEKKWGIPEMRKKQLADEAAAQKEYEKRVEESDKQTQAAIDNIEKNIERFSKAVLKGFGKAASAIARFSAIVGKEMVHSFTAAASGALKLTAAISIAPWKRLGNTVKSAVTSLTGFLSAVKRIAVYRAIRWALKEITQAFKEGIDNLYQYSLLIDGKFKDSMNMIATAALYVKNSLAAMVEPIINQVAPAIDFLADKFVDLLNTVNETFAAMTGAETWTKAIKYPIEYAEAADDAAGSAKKLRNTLLGFDEINRLDDKNKGKRGASGTVLDYSKMFEEKKVTKNAKDFVKALKDAFKSGDLTSIGESLGKNLLEGLNRIPWDSIKSAVTKNAKSVATLINGFIDVPNLGYTIGSSIAKAFNVAVSKMNEFYSTIQWDKIGTFLADGVNGVVQTFKIDDLAHNFALRVNGIAKMINKFASGVSWDSVATFLTNGITTAINEISISDLAGSIARLFKKAVDAIGKVANDTNWGKLGAWLASGINSIFKKFDTDPPIGQSIAKIINGGVTAIGKFVNDVKWEDIGTFLGDNINNFLDTFSIKDLGKTIAGLINKGVNSIFDFIDTVEWDKVGKFIGDGINSFFDELNTEKVGKTISKSVTNAIVAVKEFFKTTDFQAIGNKIGEVLKNIDWGEALKGLASVIVSAIGSGFDLLKGIWQKSPVLGAALGLSLVNLIGTAVGAPSIASILATKIGSIVGTAVASEAAATTAAGAAAGGKGASVVGAVTAGSGGILGASVSSLPVTVVAVAAAAAGVLGYSIGQFLDKNVPAVRDLADKLVEWMHGDYNDGGKVIYDDTDEKTFGNKAVSYLNNVPKGIKDKIAEMKANDLIAIDINPVLNLDEDIKKGIEGVVNWDDIVTNKTAILDIKTSAGAIATEAKTTASKVKSIKDYIDSVKSGATSQSTNSIISGSTSSKTNVIKGFASGGDPLTGSLFLAGEKGTELIASQGSHTSVYNRDQIAESVAVGNEEGNALLRQLVNLGNKILAKDTTVITPITTGQITTAMDRQNRREGKTVVPVALGG